MSLAERLRGITRVFLDSAPVIYYVEAHPDYFARVDFLFDRLDQGSVTAVTSPITLAECLVHPFKKQPPDLRKKFSSLLTSSPGVEFFVFGAATAERAAELRARHGISLLDALQIATAIQARCEVFITNDQKLKRVSETKVVTLSDL